MYIQSVKIKRLKLLFSIFYVVLKQNVVEENSINKRCLFLSPLFSFTVYRSIFFYTLYIKEQTPPRQMASSNKYIQSQLYINLYFNLLCYTQVTVSRRKYLLTFKFKLIFMKGYFHTCAYFISLTSKITINSIRLRALSMPNVSCLNCLNYFNESVAIDINK